MRLIQNDSSYVTFGDIYEEYCEEVGIGREDPIFLVVEKVKQSMKEFKKMMGRPVSPLRLLYYKLLNICHSSTEVTSSI